MTPPITGIKPKRDNLLISEKISLEFKFLFSGRITLKSFCFSNDFGSLLYKSSICFGDNSFSFAVSSVSIISLFLIFVCEIKLFTASVCIFCNSLI